jgi:hypothetical protein
MPSKTIIIDGRFFIPLSVLYRSIMGWDCSWIMMQAVNAELLIDVDTTASLPDSVFAVVDLGGAQ